MQTRGGRGSKNPKFLRTYLMEAPSDIWLGLPQQQEINVGVLLQMESSCRHKRFYEQLPGKMRKVVSPLFFRWNEGGGIRWRIK